MPAYVIFIRERALDQSELDASAQAAPPSLEGWPIKFLAAYGRQDVLEGPVPEGVAIAEFPSLEDTRRWVDRPIIYTNGPSEKIIGDYFSQNKARRVALS